MPLQIFSPPGVLPITKPQRERMLREDPGIRYKQKCFSAVVNFQYILFRHKHFHLQHNLITFSVTGEVNNKRLDTRNEIIEYQYVMVPSALKLSVVVTKSTAPLIVKEPDAPSNLPVPPVMVHTPSTAPVVP